jgi:hypothetical protein
MRRACIALVALALIAFTACGSTKPTPTVPKVNFTPEVELIVHDTSLDFSVAKVHAGSVLLVDNPGDRAHRVVGIIKTQVFDTGTMHPGAQVTVLLSTPGSLVATDLPGGETARLTVTPAPTP